MSKNIKQTPIVLNIQPKWYAVSQWQIIGEGVI